MSERFHMSAGHDLEVRGCWTLSGPQYAEHLPANVRAMFESDPHIESITVQREHDGLKGGAIYTRFPEPPAEHDIRPAPQPEDSQ